jgi:hypothetical protein
MRGQGGFSSLGGGVARRSGLTRWQSLAVITPDGLPAEVKDLQAAFADPAKRDILLQAALGAINRQIYLPLSRGRFVAESHRWHDSHGFEQSLI